MSSYKDPHLKGSLVSRLNRIEGQIRGIRNMIEDEKYCVDVLIQVAAAKSALNSVGAMLLESHIRGCVKSAIESGRGTTAIDELTEVLKKYIR